MWLEEKSSIRRPRGQEYTGKRRAEGLRVDLEASHLDDILCECPAGSTATVRNVKRLAGAGEGGRGRGVKRLDAAAG
jgi:hypothetical protein